MNDLERAELVHNEHVKALEEAGYQNPDGLYFAYVCTPAVDVIDDDFASCVVYPEPKCADGAQAHD
jgi:hypothetical protein